MEWGMFLPIAMHAYGPFSCIGITLILGTASPLKPSLGVVCGDSGLLHHPSEGRDHTWCFIGSGSCSHRSCIVLIETNFASMPMCICLPTRHRCARRPRNRFSRNRCGTKSTRPEKKDHLSAVIKTRARGLAYKGFMFRTGAV